MTFKKLIFFILISISANNVLGQVFKVDEVYYTTSDMRDYSVFHDTLGFFKNSSQRFNSSLNFFDDSLAIFYTDIRMDTLYVDDSLSQFKSKIPIVSQHSTYLIYKMKNDTIVFYSAQDEKENEYVYIIKETPERICLLKQDITK